MHSAAVLDSAAASMFVIAGLGLFALIVLVLAIPALVMLVSPRTRPAAAAVTRCIGWAVGFVVLLSLLGWFRAVRSGAQRATSANGAGDAVASVARDSQEAAIRSSVVSSGDLLVKHAEVTHTRPDWVDRPPVLHDQTYRLEVTSGLWTTQAECQRALNGAVLTAVDDYVTTYFGDEQAAQLVSIEPAYLRRHLVKQPLYAETVDASVGPMQQLHALVEFDDQVRAELHRLWRQAFVSYRLRYAGGAFALLLAALGTLFAYLKLDLATAGAFTRRLRWAAGLAILLVTAGAVGICVL